MTFCGFFQSEVASTKDSSLRFFCNKSLQTLGLTGYISSDANKRLRNFHPFLFLNELHLQRVWAACGKTFEYQIF